MKIQHDQQADRRAASAERRTSETDIVCRVDLDGGGVADIDTGIGFLDHMLTALAAHSGVSIQLTCKGDLNIDDHHTAEDCAIVLGASIDACLGDRAGITRFGYAYAPMDETLARACVDLSGRPAPAVNLTLVRERIGSIATENITHFFVSLAMNMKAAVHIDVIRGENDHHKGEAAFKAFALALRQAVSLREGGARVPSTKGVLT